MKEILERLTNGDDLSAAEASDVLVALTDEDLSPAVAGAVLTALRAKGETAEEVRGFAVAMRSLARRPEIPADPPAIDIVGTGGDGSGSLNLSTGAALLVAACGQPVVKHGNRSISSRSGSADVLEALGVTIPADPAAAVACLESTGFTFLFAPHFHPAMKAIAPVRRALGVRTIFNILGPLTNPAEPPFYLLGGFSLDVARLMAQALSGLPIRRAFVVHGTPAWDEATPVGPFTVFDVSPGSVREDTRDPSSVGLASCAAADLQGGDAAHNAGRLRAALGGEVGPHRDALALNAGLALEITGAAGDFAEGVARATAATTDGTATAFLDRLSAFEPAVGGARA